MLRDPHSMRTNKASLKSVHSVVKVGKTFLHTVCRWKPLILYVYLNVFWRPTNCWNSYCTGCADTPFAQNKAQCVCLKDIMHWCSSLNQNFSGKLFILFDSISNFLPLDQNCNFHERKREKKKYTLVTGNFLKT